MDGVEGIEDLLIAASDQGFSDVYTPSLMFERAEDGRLVAVSYDDDGAEQGRYRIDITITEGDN